MSELQSGEIEQLLQEAKLTSISDTVSFIAHHAARLALQPLHQLEDRVAELQRPKGMDRVMIEEVKTLVQAMLDQREEGMRRQLERRHHRDACSFEAQQNSRRSLNELDFLNFLNTQHPGSSQQLRKLTSQQLAPQADMRDLHLQVQGKAERRELQDLRTAVSNLSKEVVGKISFEETEKLILKFQKDVFMRLADTRSHLQEAQIKLQRQIDAESARLQRQITEIRGKTCGKVQKKVKRQTEEIISIQDKLEGLGKTSEQLRGDYETHHRGVLEDLGSLQLLVEKIAEQRDTQLLHNSHAKERVARASLWMAAPTSYKNSCVVWERQVSNQEPENIEFQSGKTGLRIVSAGFYEVVCLVFGGAGKKAPVLMINSQATGKLQSHGGESFARWQMREWLHVRQSRSQISLKVQGEDNFACVLMSLTKIAP